jgi:hypothetical protein
VQLYLPSFLFGTWRIWPPNIEVGVACFLNGEAGALEMRSQVVEQGWVAGS